MLTKIQIYNLAISALEAKALRLAERYGKDHEASRSEIVKKMYECHQQMDWLREQIDAVKNNLKS